MKKTLLFLHGLDSSGQGTKGKWFAEHFPEMLIHDYHGTLDQRLAQLQAVCGKDRNLILVGSSFGGLMATCFALHCREQCKRLILLAPALNFDSYTPPQKKLQVPTQLIIGKEDTVTPPDLVLPLAEQTFSRLSTAVLEDDHMLHASFFQLDWQTLLGEQAPPYPPEVLGLE